MVVHQLILAQLLSAVHSCFFTFVGILFCLFSVLLKHNSHSTRMYPTLSILLLLLLPKSCYARVGFITSQTHYPTYQPIVDLVNSPDIIWKQHDTTLSNKTNVACEMLAEGRGFENFSTWISTHWFSGAWPSRGFESRRSHRPSCCNAALCLWGAFPQNKFMEPPINFVNWITFTLMSEPQSHSNPARILLPRCKRCCPPRII